jgi:outer membrane receptor protein involved in Fe transport
LGAAEWVAGHHLSRHWQVALNVNNGFDKRYYLSEETPNPFF